MDGSRTSRVAGSPPRSGRPATLAQVGRDRRAAVSLIVAVTAPVLLTAVAMGVEVANWSTQKLNLQRAADSAALAGVAAITREGTNFQAASAAANVAEMSGISGGTRSWSPSALVLADNQATVKITSGLRNSYDPAVLVTVQGTIPLLLSRLITAATSISMQATAMAELGPQPCVLTLGGNGSGISASGNVVMNLPGCALYSDSSQSFNGSVTLNAAALYAAGTVNVGSNVTGTGTNTAIQTSGAPVITDPYATDTALQSALAQANCAPTVLPVKATNTTTGITTVTLSPNTCYGSMKITGSDQLVFNGPGLYTVNGSLTVTGNSSQNTTIDASGITIASTGPISISGSFNTGAVTLTAATVSTAQNGAIPGVLFATSSNIASTVAGNAPIPYTGLLYMPNSSLSFSGTPSSASGGCDKVIAQSVSLVGDATLASSCSSYALSTLGALPNNKLIQLVE